MTSDQSGQNQEGPPWTDATMEVEGPFRGCGGVSLTTQVARCPPLNEHQGTEGRIHHSSRGTAQVIPMPTRMMANVEAGQAGQAKMGDELVAKIEAVRMEQQAMVESLAVIRDTEWALAVGQAG